MMSVAASRIALERAGLDAREIDCVVVATVSHLLQTPAVATAVAHELGTEQAAAFDISAACSGFCHGIAMAADFIRAGSARHVRVRDHLTSSQEKAMATQPDMIAALAHRLKRAEQSEGRDVEVHADVFVVLNGRPGARLVDPAVDLGAVARGGLASRSWVLPLPE